jgi:hypothetical protein
MRGFHELMQNPAFKPGLSYSSDVALMLQPGSFADFHRHQDFVEAFRRWTQGDQFRGLDIVRLWSLVINIKHVLNGTSGSLAELGVYGGQSSAVLSFYAEQFGRKMYLLDSFQGFSEAQLEPDMAALKQTAFKDVTLENAKSVVGQYTGNRWVVGFFPDSVTAEMRDDVYAFVSIDCDIYMPIIEGLEFFWPRLSENGMIFVHDYSSGHWEGATRAVDEFCHKYGISGVLLSDLSGTFVLTRSSSITALEKAQADEARLRSELAAIHDSRSWRLTAPLRSVKALLNVVWRG